MRYKILFKKITAALIALVCILSLAGCTVGTYTGTEEEIVAKLPSGYPYSSVPLCSPVELVVAESAKLGNNMQYKITYNSSSTYTETVTYYEELLPTAYRSNYGLATGFSAPASESLNVIVYILDSRSSGSTGECTVVITVTATGV